MKEVRSIANNTQERVVTSAIFPLIVVAVDGKKMTVKQKNQPKVRRSEEPESGRAWAKMCCAQSHPGRNRETEGDRVSERAETERQLELEQIAAVGNSELFRLSIPCANYHLDRFACKGTLR